MSMPATATAIRGERGMVLIVVLLVITLLTITVVEFTFSTALDAHRARHARDALQANLLARSGVNIAEGFLMLDDEPDFDSHLEEWWIQAQQTCREGLQLAPNMLVRCRIRDESGKINVNLTRGRMRRVESETVTADAVLRDAVTCLFHNRNVSSVGDQEINERLNEYWSQDPIERPDGQQQEIPDFASLEDFGAQFGLTGDELRSLREVLTAQPRRLLPAVNVNTASAEVLSAILNPEEQCAPNDAVTQILERRAEEPYRRNEIGQVVSGAENAAAKRGLLGSTSNLFRVQASAVVNFDPESPGDFGGVAQTLSVVVRRRPDPKRAIPDQNVPGWTLRAIDWQKEGGARLFQGSEADEEDEDEDDEDADEMGEENGQRFLPPLER
jgi:general secretion pathway protein K